MSEQTVWGSNVTTPMGRVGFKYNHANMGLTVAMGLTPEVFLGKTVDVTVFNEKKTGKITKSIWHPAWDGSLWIEVELDVVPIA